MDMAPQEKITFQPGKGFRELLEAQARKLDRSLAWVINRYIETGLKKDGLLKAPKS